MRRLKISEGTPQGVIVDEASSHIAIVSKCLKSDIKDGKEWCIYKHDETGKGRAKTQPKGWPKHFDTKEKADEHVKRMHTFK